MNLTFGSCLETGGARRTSQTESLTVEKFRNGKRRPPRDSAMILFIPRSREATTGYPTSAPTTVNDPPACDRSSTLLTRHVRHPREFIGKRSPTVSCGKSRLVNERGWRPWLQRHCMTCDVLVQGSVGSNVVKCFGIVEPESPARSAIVSFQRHFRVLVDGIAVCCL
jgi:hypothetical protein